jgi:predicted naringenin-chalcone synthase
LANIISIGTALPENCHPQHEILHFMQKAYKLDETEARKLAFLYRHSDIKQRYSVIEDFGKPGEQWEFVQVNGHGNPTLNERMKIFHQYALSLSVDAINDCINNIIDAIEITHLITVSCTGMSAPGLDLEVAEALNLSPNVFRTSVNFMGCYAAIHALKIAKMICDSTSGANVVIVCTELCTIHFQQEYTLDNASSSLLFGDGSAAVLVSNNISSSKSLKLKSFYSEVAYRGKTDMSWQLSNDGFLMTLSAYVPQLIKEDIKCFVHKALIATNLEQDAITHWCIHPGGRKILEVIQTKLGLTDQQLSYSKDVLSEFGNMSSPTILFILKQMQQELNGASANVFGVAFGPGLTMETFIASKE